MTTKDRFTITYHDNIVTVTRAVKDGSQFAAAVTHAVDVLRFFKQTKPGRVWGCDGVGYDIQKRIGMVRINKSGVDAHSFQKGIAACV